MLQELRQNQTNLTKQINYFDYDDENNPISKTFTISGEDLVNHIEYHASDRLMPIIDGVNAATYLSNKWSHFIMMNQDRFTKLLSLVLRQYNGLNNYEGHSLLTTDIGARGSEDSYGKKESQDVRGQQIVTNEIGARSGTSSDDSSNLASSFDTDTSSLANGANLSSSTTQTDAATDKSTVGSYTDSHTSESYKDTHKEDAAKDVTKEFKFGNLGVSTGADMISKEQAIRQMGYPEIIFIEFINQYTIY